MAMQVRMQTKKAGRNGIPKMRVAANITTTSVLLCQHIFGVVLSKLYVAINSKQGQALRCCVIYRRQSY